MRDICPLKGEKSKSESELCFVVKDACDFN